MRWLAAYNYHLADWSTGGKDVDYPRPHWDIYEVDASYRDEVEKAAKAMRRQHRSLPESQRFVLKQIVERAGAAHDVDVDASDLDRKVVCKLVSKGLVREPREGFASATRAAFNAGVL